VQNRGKAHRRSATGYGNAKGTARDRQSVKGARIHVLGRNAAAKAAGSLRHSDPLASAALGITKAQTIALLGILAGLISLGILAPLPLARALHYALWFFFAVSIVFRTYCIFIPAPLCLPIPVKQGATLPVYTLLIPLYKEAGMLNALCKSIGKINYPAEKLDIKLLLEADDKETLRALKTNYLGRQWEVIIMPPVGPKTKPKALNAGFARARGDLVTIYDAEDQPHPDQLRHAVHAFAQDRDGQLGCVQAPLGYYNAEQNWLTEQFALEYAAHFRVLVPAMARLGLPFPLGGTSNHFRAKALRDVGAWDPYNVTEDADLGFRLNAHGWQLGTITPPTLEEAVAGLKPWQRQRSRWLKGYVQTLGVHLRRPAEQRSWRGALAMTLTLGTAVFAAFGHASFSILMLGLMILSPWTGHFLLPADYGLAAVGMGVGVMMLGVGAKRAGLHTSVWELAGAMLYWPLQSWAMAKAIIDLVKRPFHWEKTHHGLCPPAKSPNGLEPHN
jgi:cellulose synthase/poly-beta-1,6-N-acetylglucosamine synthase-like glycosyltransferase